MNTKKTVAILCTEGLEECEALVTRDLLYRAGLDVKLYGKTKTVHSSREMSFVCDHTFEEAEGRLFDCLVLPGGMPGTLSLEADPLVQGLIDAHIEAGRYVAAICAAPSILIHKGLISDNKFTCAPGFENGLTRAGGKSVINGKIITACGLGGVMEFSYDIIRSLLNEDTAKDVWRKIGY